MPPGSVSKARTAAAFRPSTSTMSREGAPRANEINCAEVMTSKGTGCRRPGLSSPTRHLWTARVGCGRGRAGVNLTMRIGGMTVTVSDTHHADGWTIEDLDHTPDDG